MVVTAESLGHDAVGFRRRKVGQVCHDLTSSEFEMRYLLRRHVRACPVVAQLLICIIEQDPAVLVTRDLLIGKVDLADQVEDINLVIGMRRSQFSCRIYI